jgi:hypothetical protein
MKIGKYMTVEPVGTLGHETWVVSSSKGQQIGFIEWHPPWRRYVFNAESDAIFSHDCLAQLSRFCERLEINSP